MKVDNFILFLTAGTEKINNFIDEKGNTGNSFFNKRSIGHLQFFPTFDFLRSFHTILKILDWFSIISVIVGLLVVSTSHLGNNGKWKKAGYHFIIVGYLWVIFYHTIVIIAPAFGQLGEMKLMTFVMMFLGQLLMYAASSTLFTIASHNMEIYEMAGTPVNDRQKIQTYNAMIIALVAGAVSYFIAGLI